MVKRRAAEIVKALQRLVPEATDEQRDAALLRVAKAINGPRKEPQRCQRPRLSAS